MIVNKPESDTGHGRFPSDLYHTIIFNTYSEYRGVWSLGIGFGLGVPVAHDPIRVTPPIETGGPPVDQPSGDQRLSTIQSGPNRRIRIQLASPGPAARRAVSARTQLAQHPRHPIDGQVHTAPDRDPELSDSVSQLGLPVSDRQSDGRPLLDVNMQY